MGVARKLGDKGSSVQIRPLRPLIFKVSGRNMQAWALTLRPWFYSLSVFLFRFSSLVTVESAAR